MHCFCFPCSLAKGKVALKLIFEFCALRVRFNKDQCNLLKPWLNII